MYELDKARFGAFVAERRKAQSMTQKELARRLFVSDKAVSKWETGVSLPDVALLTPLAAALQVTVSELLEGASLDGSALEPARVEALVQRAIAYPEEEARRPGLRNKKRVAAFLGCLLLAALQTMLLPMAGADPARMWQSYALLQVLAAVFGFYFWLLAKERLPRYYDENRITSYNDGPFRMNMPGVSFNNRNWPHILKGCRVWSAAVLVGYPPVWLAVNRLLPPSRALAGGMVLLALVLCGLFVPIFVLGRKYQ